MAPGRVVVRTTSPKANGQAGPVQGPRRVQPKGPAAAAPVAAGPKKTGPAKTAAPAQAAGKVSNGPPTRRVVNGVPGRAAPAGKPVAGKVSPKTTQAAPEGGQDTSALEERLAAVEAQNAELKALLIETKDTFLTAITSLHDMLVQTGGTMQFTTQDENGDAAVDENGNPIQAPLPELTAHPDKILAWANNTAWDGYEAPAGEAAQGEEGDEGQGEEGATEE